MYIIIIYYHYFDSILFVLKLYLSAIDLMDKVDKDITSKQEY